MGGTIVLRKGVFGEAMACALVGDDLRPCYLVKGENVAIFATPNDARKAIVRSVDAARSNLIDRGYPVGDMAKRESWLKEFHLLTV